MRGQETGSLLTRLKRAVKKITLLLTTTRYSFSRWRLASLILRGNASVRSKRRVSFNDRLGLKYEPAEEEEIGGEQEKAETHCGRIMRRTRSYGNNQYEDIDERAEIFIRKFRQQLLLERQVSLQLRYLQGSSSFKDYDKDE